MYPEISSADRMYLYSTILRIHYLCGVVASILDQIPESSTLVLPLGKVLDAGLPPSF